ncbi:hypothetical protein ABW20_dc0101660 [Dactylellina cionopaga]|nr:hypothetical protein ABW20_dc0101660 [Dactylellina cionopaga]
MAARTTNTSAQATQMKTYYFGNYNPHIGAKIEDTEKPTTFYTQGITISNTLTKTINNFVEFTSQL